MVAGKDMIDLLLQLGSCFWQVAVLDRIYQQILEADLLEDFAKNVENAALECFVLNFELAEQPMVDIAFTGFLGNQIPQVADLGLSDSVDTTKTLFETIWIPRQVIVDHQARVLQVDTFTRCISRDQNSRVGIAAE